MEFYDHLLGRCASDTCRKTGQITELTVFFRDYFANAPTNTLQSPNNEEESEGHEEDSVRLEERCHLLLTDTWLRCTQTLLPWRNKCFSANGDYVEVWCVVSATICHAHTEVRIHFSASVYVPYFVTPLHEISLWKTMSYYRTSRSSFNLYSGGAQFWTRTGAPLEVFRRFSPSL